MGAYENNMERNEHNTESNLNNDFDSNVLQCASDAEKLKHFSYKRKSECGHHKGQKKKKKKTGPKISSVKLKAYHLPPCSDRPKFNSYHDPVVVNHYNNGYGFAKSCYDVSNCKIKSTSIPYGNDLKSELHKMFPKLQPNFHLFKLDSSGTYHEIELRTTQDLRALNYQGTLVLCNEIPSGAKRLEQTLTNASSTITRPLLPELDTSTRISSPPIFPAAIDLTSINASQLLSSQSSGVVITSTSAARNNLVNSVASSTITKPLSELNTQTGFPIYPASLNAASIVSNQSVPARIMPSQSLPSQSSGVTISTSTAGNNLVSAVITPVVASSMSTSVSTISLPVPNSLPGRSSLLHSVVPASEIRSRLVGSLELRIMFSAKTEVFHFNRNQNPADVFVKMEELYPVLVGKTYTIENIDEERPTLRRSSRLPLRYSAKDKETFRVVCEDRDIFKTVSYNSPCNLVELEELRLNVLSTFIGYFELLIQRNSIVAESLNQFDFSNKKIKVTFLGEQGVDVDGVSRSFFADFWENFCKLYGIGHAIFNFDVNPDKLKLTTKELKNAGKILISGYIIAGYLPPFVNHSVLFKLLCGEPSQDYINASFLDCVDDVDRGILEKAVQMKSFDLTTLVNILYQYNFSSLPSPQTIQHTISNLSRYASLIKPWYILHWMMEGIKETTDSPMAGISETLFESFMEQMMPSGQAISSRLKPSYITNDGNLYAAEERTFGFLERFLLGISKEKAAVFMKFVSGCERLCDVYVEFNSESADEKMIPTASTCGVVLCMSRYFLSQEHFDRIFKNLLDNDQLWKSFEVF